LFQADGARQIDRSWAIEEEEYLIADAISCRIGDIPKVPDELSEGKGLGGSTFQNVFNLKGDQQRL
jgi:hypothetical protein